MSKAKFTSGNEKHVVYKKTTKRGEGKIGDIMVNHPTKDKGTYDTISLTRTSNAKTVKQGIAAEKKWHADNPMKMLSGAKSVKQYRGDENLPEAKNGMKKGCGCKHSKSKYKYQSGERDIAADKLEYGDDYEAALKNNFGKELELPEGDVPMTYASPAQKVQKVQKLQRVNKTAPVVNKNINTVKRKTVRTFPNVGGDKRIITEKIPVVKNSSTVYNAPRKREIEYSNRVQKYVDNLPGDLIPQRDTTYSLDKETGKMVRHLPNINRMYGKKKLGYTYKDLTPEEKGQVLYEQKLRTANRLREEANISNNSAKYRKLPSERSDGSFNKMMNKKGITKAVSDIKNFSSSVENKSGYKYGTGALTIPEGSAIVTANKGKNKQALMAYKKGNYKLLNKIIDDMPEDNVDKAQAGRKSLEARYKQLGELTGPLSEAEQKEFDDIKTQLTEDEYDIYDDKRIAEKFGQKYDVDKAKYRSSLKGGKLNLKENTTNANYRESLRDPKVLKAEIAAGKVKVDDKGNISYTAIGSSARGNQEFLGTTKKGTLPELKGLDPEKTPEEIPPPGTTDTTDTNAKKSFSMPSMAEIAARSSILAQGIEGVPENYLKLGRYNYASQLPKTLQEISLAEQSGRNAARDIVGGDAGRYLAQAGSLSASRMKANNDAVVQDTLARQDILNKNVDLGNREAEANTGLRNEYATLRGKARSAYNDQLVGLGQRIDSASETAQEMSNQKNADAQRMQILKDLGQNYQYQNVDGLNKLVTKNTTTPTTSTTPVTTTKKGSKKLKTYKRK